MQLLDLSGFHQDDVRNPSGITQQGDVLHPGTV